MLPFFPLDVLGEIWDLVGAVSEGFPSYSLTKHFEVNSTNVTENNERNNKRCLGFNGPLRQYFSLYQAVSLREGEREEKR